MGDWLSIRVMLRSGAGRAVTPPPGRVLLVRNDHTFADLADGIDVAFARWDLTPSHEFAVEGRILRDEGVAGPDEAGEDSAQVGVGDVGLRAGARFTYSFDPGERWRHDCVVEDTEVDPFEVAGTEPDICLPVFGWGTIPDQYWRVRPDDDAGWDSAGAPADGDDAWDLDAAGTGVDDGWDDEDWDDEGELEAEAWRAVARTLDVAGEPPEPELRAVTARIRRETAAPGWAEGLLLPAAALEPDDLPGDDVELWLELAAATVAPRRDLALPPETLQAWASIEPPELAAAVIELVRRGPGCDADAQTMLDLLEGCVDVDTDPLTAEDEEILLDGLAVFAALWQALGVLDGTRQLTELGRWGLPAALRRAWVEP